MIHDLIFQELVPGCNTAARDQMIRITCATMAGSPVCSGSIRRVARKRGNLGGGLGIYTSSKQGKRSSSRALMFIFIGTSTLRKLGEGSIILQSPLKKSVSLNRHMYPSEDEYIYLCTLIRYLGISGYIYPL